MNSNSITSQSTHVGFESLKDYNVVVITEICLQPDAVFLCDTCRENNVGFIYACALGLSGFTFIDFGDKYMIKDTNGEREHLAYEQKVHTMGHKNVMKSCR